MDDEHHERISQLAHQVWESAGRPVGKDAEHWQAARRLIEAEEADGATNVAGPTAPGDVAAADRSPEPEILAAAAALD